MGLRSTAALYLSPGNRVGMQLGVAAEGFSACLGELLNPGGSWPQLTISSPSFPFSGLHLLCET